MAKMEKDILDDEKLSREREVDKERDEDRHSKEVQRMKEKETISKSNAILENSKIDVLRDSKSRDILEKAIRIHKNNCRELQQQYAEKFSKIDLSKKGSREVEQAARLSREIRTLQSNIDKIHERLNPHMAREKINSTERSQDLIKRVEKNEIMISSGKIEIRPTYVSKVASLDKEKVSLALDIAKYQSLTGMSLSNDAKSTISKLDIKRSSERIIPKQELEKIATSKHPEAIKTFYEMGLRIGDERLRPEQLNNVFKAISITEDRAGKIEIIDRMLAGKIQNIKMSEKDIEKLSKDCTRIGIEKQTKKSEIQKSQQKQDRDKDRSDLKKELLRQPEKTNEKVKDLLLSSQEKLNLNELSSIIKQSDALLDSKGLKSERIELSSDEIRQIALGNHPENLSIAFQLGARIGENLRVDDKKLNIAINLLDELKERDETIRLTYISSAIKPIDEREGKVFIGREDEKDKIEKLLNVQINSSLSIRERNECLRKELERINHPEKFEQREKTPEKREVEPLDLRGLDAKEAAKEISRFLGEICQKERTSSEDRKSYVAAQRDDKDYSREYVLQQLSLARETIRDERIDIRSMDVKDIALRDKDLISIVSRDPQLLIDVQRMGIPITRNGFINEEKLQKKIDLLTEYSKDEARRKEGMFSIEDRVAIISSAWARNTGQHIALSNSVNMMDSRANDYVKATAIKFATLDEYLKLSSEERSNPKNNYLSKVAYERNTELDRYRHASTKINLERNIFDGRYSDMRDFYKSHKNLFSDKSVDRKTQIIKELDDKREDRPKTLNGFHSELILSKNFEGYLRDIIELSRNDDKHERYEKDNIEINKGFVLINQEQLERLISILPPVREDRDQVLPPFNERGQTMPNIDITDRLVLLNATGITHDLLSKSDNIPYSLLQDRQRDIEKRTEEFQDYLERLYDTRNPLDSKISSEIILDYFKNIRYDARLVSPEKELSDYIFFL